MGDATKSVLAVFLWRSGIANAYRSTINNLGGNPVTILCTHRVLDKSGPDRDLDELYLSRGYLSIEDFETKLQFLRREYEIIPLETCVRSLENGTSLPANCVVFTFDDGYVDNYMNVYPLLKRYGVPATFFLVTDYISSEGLKRDDQITAMMAKSQVRKLEVQIGRQTRQYDIRTVKGKADAVDKICRSIMEFDEYGLQRFLKYLSNLLGVPSESSKLLDDPIMMSWSQVIEMSQNPLVSFGAHTCTHPKLASIPEQRIRWEVVRSKTLIQERIGKPVEIFSYPYGKRRDFDHRVKQIVAQAGFRAACTFLPGKNSRKADRYALRRIEFSAEPLHIFRIRMTGVLDVFSRLRAG